MRLIIRILLSMVFLMSCKKEQDDHKAYYQFTVSEFDRIPKYMEGDTIVYVNQSGDSLTFEVTKADLRLKTPYQQLGFFGYASYFLYDAVSYNLTPLNSLNANIEYYFSKLPIDIDTAKYQDTKLFPAVFHVQVDFPFWNSLSNQNFRERTIKLPDMPTTSMQVSNVLYPEVVKIVANNQDTTQRPTDVHTLYYGFKHGIIGFDDVSGNQWQLRP